MIRLAVFLALALFLLMPTSVAAAECQFVLGFATLRDLVGHEIVGECLENEHHNEIGDSVQQTTGGLLVWRKADNWTAFTDGYRSWINGPNGLEQRLNVELLPWEAHNWIDTLPWVKDGISSTETRSVSALRILGVKYSRVFRALLESERDWLHTQGNPQHLPLEALLTVSAIDETAVMQLVQMPFLASYEVVDSVAIESLGRLSSQSLRQVVSHPSLGEFNTDEVAIRIVLLALRESDPEAAAKIEALSWVRDGIRSTPREDFRLGYIDPVKFERSVVQTLVRYSSRYRTFFQALVGKAWFQDGLHRREPEVIHDLEIIAQFGAPLGVQIIGMPFLDSVEEGDPTLLDQWIALLWDDPADLYWILSHSRLAGGISHEQRATALILRLEREYQAAAAVMWAMPWIQDGVAESDFLPVFWLQQLALNSDQAFYAVAQKPWVQDGLNQDEQAVISRLTGLCTEVLYGGKNSLRRDVASALLLIDMPFLESINAEDVKISDSLLSLHRAPDQSYLPQVLDHPKLRGGIRDDQLLLMHSLGKNPSRALDFLDSLP